MEEYMNTLLEQLRCKKAREVIRQEISNHIQDQTDEYILQGVSEEEARQLAVKEMGDPVETGVSLDRIHRPQIAWSIIGIAAIISLVSMIIHFGIGYTNSELGISYIKNSMVHILLGFAVMLLVYRLDYSFMAKYGKVVAVLFLLFIFFAIYLEPTTYNGARSFVRVGGLYISIIYFMLLYVPIYGSIIYQAHGSGYMGIIKLLFWMGIPILMSRSIPCLSLVILLFFMMSLLLTIAVCKNWFCINKKMFLGIFWSSAILVPFLYSIFAIKFEWLAVYQIERLKVFLGITSRPKDSYFIGYILKEYALSSRLFGTNGKKVIGYLPDYNSSYILTFLSSYYGILVAIVVCCLLAFVIVKTFQISLSQKNQLGMIMGCGCGLVLGVSTAINILECTGMLLVTQTFLPFVSYGGTGVLVSYILLGIVLSIYRYKSILPTNPRIAQTYKIKIMIEKQ